MFYKHFELKKSYKKNFITQLFEEHCWGFNTSMNKRHKVKKEITWMSLNPGYNVLSLFCYLPSLSQGWKSSVVI